MINRNRQDRREADARKQAEQRAGYRSPAGRRKLEVVHAQFALQALHARLRHAIELPSHERRHSEPRAEPDDHGAAWRNSPEVVTRSAYWTSAML